MDAAAERRLLLDFLLKDFTRRGGRVLANESLATPAVLDSLDVQILLKSITSPGAVVDIAKCRRAAGSLARNPSLQKTSTGPDGVAVYTLNTTTSLNNQHQQQRRLSGPNSNPFASDGGSSNPFLESNPTGDGGNPFAVRSASASHHAGSKTSTWAGAPPRPGTGSAGGVYATTPPSGSPHSPGPLQAHHTRTVSEPALQFLNKGTATPPTKVAALPPQKPTSTSATPQQPQPMKLVVDYSSAVKQQGAKDRYSAGGKTSGGKASGSGAQHDEDVGGEEGGEKVQQPEIDMLKTDLSDDTFKELALLMVMSALPPGMSGNGTQPPGKVPAVDSSTALLVAIRGQLEINESTARDMASVLRHVSTGSWTSARRCSLEGLVCMMAAARPHDFNMLGGTGKGFKAWTRWRRSMAAVLVAAANLKHQALGRSQESLKLVARLKGAIRRMDVAVPEDFEEDEYREAAGALQDAVRQLAFADAAASSKASQGPAAGVGADWATFDDGSKPLRSYASATAPGAGGPGSGWQLPWAIRAKLADILISAMFDTLSEGSYIDEVSALQSFLDTTLWPALGVTSTMALAVSTWAHFRQYLSVGEAWLAKQLKMFITKLSSNVSAVRLQRNASLKTTTSSTVMATPSQGPATPLSRDDEMEADSQLSAQVGKLVVEHLIGRLSDYHQHYPSASHQQALSVMVDTTVSAAGARGDTSDGIAVMLADAVAAAVAAAFSRYMDHQERHEGLQEGTSAELLTALECADQVWKAETSLYASIFKAYVPHQQALVAAKIHACVGAGLLPWVRQGVSLSQDSMQVLRGALKFDASMWRTVFTAKQQLQQAPSPTAQAKGGVSDVTAVAAASSAVAADRLRTFLRWELDIPIQQAMNKWVHERGQAKITWVERQVSLEKWQPISSQESYSQSSVEILALSEQAVDALLGMQLPVDQKALEILLGYINTAYTKYAQFMVSKMGPHTRLIPEHPPVTRFKKPFVVKQEEAEAAMVAASNPAYQHKPKSKGAMSTLKNFGKSLLPPSKEQNNAGEDEPVGFLESVPPIQGHPQFNSLKFFAPSVISCFIMSGQHILDKIPHLVASVKSKWPQQAVSSDVSQQPGNRTSKPGNDEMHGWIDGCFNTSRQQLMDMQKYACVFLATKVVFWDMRYGWLEQLYRHRVLHTPVGVSGTGRSGAVAALLAPPPFSCRIDPLLEGLNQVLSEACADLPDALRAVMATELLTAATIAWQRVILDGGPCRWYIPEDVPSLRDDLQALDQLFTADGEGLPRNVVDPLLAPCKRLLLLVGCEIGQLISLLKAARVQGRATLRTAGSGQEVFDEAVLMRCLARRPDRTGSKLLKKEYKMSRRVKH